jgi:hypothetical protein
MCECGKKGSINDKSRYFKSIFHKQYMERVTSETTIPVVPSPVVPTITDTYLNRGICHIALDQEQFENITQQENDTNDYYDYTDYYDYIEQQYDEYREY